MNITKHSSKAIRFKALGMLIVLFAVMFSAANSYSQDNGEKRQKKTPEERAQKRADKMKEKLSLTDDQHKQIYDIILSQTNEMRSLRESGKNDQDKTARKEKMKSLRDSYNSQINSVLTSTQQQLWETHKKEMKEKHKGKKHHGKKHNKGEKKKK